MRHAVGCPTSLLRKRSGINLEKRNLYSVVLVVNKVTVLDGSSKVAALCSISVEVALAVVDVVNEDDLSVCHQYALRTEYYCPFFLLSSVLAITRQPETLLQRNQVQSPFPRSHAPRGRSPLLSLAALVPVLATQDRPGARTTVVHHHTHQELCEIAVDLCRCLFRSLALCCRSWRGMGSGG